MRTKHPGSLGRDCIGSFSHRYGKMTERSDFQKEELLWFMVSQGGRESGKLSQSVCVDGSVREVASQWQIKKTEQI